MNNFLSILGRNAAFYWFTLQYIGFHVCLEISFKVDVLSALEH